MSLSQTMIISRIKSQNRDPFQASPRLDNIIITPWQLTDWLPLGGPLNLIYARNQANPIKGEHLP